MSLKKFLATVVLGGVLGSSIYAADNPKAGSNLKDDKKIVLVGKEAAFQSTIQRFYEELKAEMNKQPAKKPESAKKAAHNPGEPEKIEKVVLGLVNSQLKDDENKVAAGVNANAVINNGKLEDMVVSGHAGRASVAMSYNVRSGNSITNLSYADKKGSRVDVTLRNHKDPLVKAYVRLSKAISSGFVYDFRTNYSSANVAVNYRRMSGSANYENINSQERTTARISYAPPIKPFKSVSVARVEFNGVECYDFNALSRIGIADVGFGAKKIEGERIVPSVFIKVEYKK